MAPLAICCFFLFLLGSANGNKTLHSDEHYSVTHVHLDLNLLSNETKTTNITEIIETTKSPNTKNGSGGNSNFIKLGGDIIPTCDRQMLCVGRCDISVGPNRESPSDGSPEILNVFGDINSHTMDTSMKKRTTNDHFVFNVNEDEKDMTQTTSASGKSGCFNDIHLEESSCSPQCPWQANVCFCDDNCFVYGDCCADVFESCLGFVDAENISIFISENFETIEVLDDLSQAMEDNNLVLNRFLFEYGACIEVEQTIQESVILIDKCPKNFADKELESKCRKPESPLLPPVTVNLQGNLVSFKNIFCAQCHTTVDSILPWKSALMCADDLSINSDKSFTLDDIISLVKEDICNVSFSPPREAACDVRQCHQTLFFTSEKEQALQNNEEIGMCSSFDALLCKVYLLPSGDYKNPHCMKCLDVEARPGIWRSKNEDGAMGNGAKVNGTEEDGTKDKDMKENGTKENDPKEDGPKKNDTKEDGSKEDGQKEDRPKEDDTKELGTKEDVTNEDNIQDEGTKDDGTKEDAANYIPVECPDVDPIRNPGIATEMTGGILIILDITGHYFQNKGRSRRTNYICAENEVFDSLTQECRTLVCQRGYEPFRGECIKSEDVYIVDKSTQVFPDTWDMMFVYFSVTDIDNECFSGCWAYGLSDLESTIPDFSIQNVSIFTNMRYCQSKVPIPTDGTVCQEHVIDMEIDVFRKFEIYLQTANSLSRDFIDQLYTMADNMVLWFTVSEMTVTSMIPFNGTKNICPKGLVAKNHTKFSLSEYKGTVYAVPESTDVEISYPLQSIGYEIKVYSDEELFTIQETIIVCEESELFSRENCSAISYWLNETLKNGTQILILETEITYHAEDFEIVGDEVFVCISTNLTSGILGSSEKDIVYFVISGVFTSISIFFLLLMLILYCMFPELCTLPGKLTASLAATMMLTFVANLFTLVDLHNDYICPVAAALSHLVTLAHFGWMAAIAVNMAMTFGFRAMNNVRSSNEGKTFLRYNMVVWGLSIIIVITAVVLDATHHDIPDSITLIANNFTNKTDTSLEEDLDTANVTGFPRYGYPYCTWFSGDMWTRLAFVIVPFFITYIIALVGFIITLVGIHQASKSAKKLGKQSSDRTRCLIYFKLSTAMGFCWILSLVLVAFPEATALKYCYVILVLLQGGLLFLAFMVNKRVYTLVSRRFRPDTKSSAKPTTQTSGLMSNNL